MGVYHHWWDLLIPSRAGIRLRGCRMPHLLSSARASTVSCQVAKLPPHHNWVYVCVHILVSMIVKHSFTAVSD